MADSSQSPRAPYSYEEPRPSLASNILAIVGFIILIVIVIWGLVHLAGISRTWFSSLFDGSSASIEVSAPESATSGSPFNLSWEYDEPVSGTYALLYQCQGGLQIQTPAPSGAANGIPCGAAFTLASAEKEISLTPWLSGNQALEVPLTIIFMPTGTGTEAQGSATVTVAPLVAPTPSPAPATPTPTPTPTLTPSTNSGQTTTVAGPADLSVRITSVSIDAYGNGVATFTISNVGGSASGSYYFTASLPTIGGYTYTSPTQSPLAPGASMANTLRFSPGTSGTASVSIIKPGDNSGNNYASWNTSAPAYGSYNYNPYPMQYAPTVYPQMYGGWNSYDPYSGYSPYWY